MMPQSHLLSKGRTILSANLSSLIYRIFSTHSYPASDVTEQNCLNEKCRFKQTEMAELKKASHIKKQITAIKYEVRPIRKEDIPQTLDIWKETGVYGGDYLHTWLAFDPEGIHVAVTDSGEVLGACAGVINHDDLAFFGAYSVREKYQRQGIGFKIYLACNEHIGARNAGLNAVPGKLELYRDKYGFSIVENKWDLLVNEIYENISPENLSYEVPKGVYIENCRIAHLPLIYEYDCNLVGYRRDLAIKFMVQEQDTESLVATKDGECVGFGVIKKTYRGVHHIGPLYANDAAVAEVILRRLIVSTPEIKGLYMATVSNNVPANDFVKKLGCPKLELCPRLTRKEMANVDTNRIFALFDMHFTLF
ncbi:uncharacterized protein LOC118202031 [Stegodyphus dumicola]|uniref:uncharacterized protein LOC118202031 n=1 Tax=Stegodyphus dumicola TaxID=202533 RepID=UPI0015AB0ED4|nr:uncharacterized protein LOC118202031 [Stegodyphus dumicola]